jgi:hypothetical protein
MRHEFQNTSSCHSCYSSCIGETPPDFDWVIDEIESPKFHQSVVHPAKMCGTLASSNAQVEKVGLASYVLQSDHVGIKN